MSVVTTSAVLLRAFNYSETSRVLRFYTRDHGVLGVMARGVRRASGKAGTGLETFARGRLTLHHRPHRDLQTFREFAPEAPHRGLAAHVIRFAGASLLAELVLEHAGADPNPDVFDRLDNGLALLETVPEEQLVGTVLVRAWGIVGALGYAPQIEPCVHCEESLEADAIGRFDFAAGGVRCPRCSPDVGGPRVGPAARSQLQDLFLGALPEDLLRPRAQLRLLSDFVTYHVSEGRPLQSFAFLASLLPHAPEAG